jgi:hypothetical protein
VPSGFDYAARAREVGEARRALDAANRLPTAGRKNVKAAQARQAALDRWYGAVEAAYPPGFWDAYDALKRGDPSGAEEAIAFLEADPWFFRSGYTKEKLLLRLTRLELTPRQAQRLRHVVLAAVDFRDRREFRRFSRLARKVDSPDLRAALRERLHSPDEGVQRRAQWVLQGLSA